MTYSVEITDSALEASWELMGLPGHSSAASRSARSKAR
jgi:hypothetical protein